MKKRFKFFSKLYKYENEEEIELKSDHGLLLDFTDSEWFGNKNKGLADYLNEPGYSYVEYIRYHYARGGYIEFDVLLNVDEDMIVDGMNIVDYVKDHISGQISDGWGENGLYVIESGWIGDSATVCQANPNLIDYGEYRKLNPDPDFVGMGNGIGA